MQDVTFNPFGREQPARVEIKAKPTHPVRHAIECSEHQRRIGEILTKLAADEPLPRSLTPNGPDDPQAGLILLLMARCNSVLLSLQSEHGAIPDAADGIFLDMIESMAEATGKATAFLQVMKHERI